MSVENARALLGAFDAIRIINLPHRADRRRETDKEFRRIGLPIDGTRISYSPAQRPSHAGGFETIGTRGCYLSHLAVLSESLKAGHDTLLILEDDISFTGHLDEHGAAIARSLAAHSWGVFYGGYEKVTLDGFAHVGATQSAPADVAIQTAHCVAFTRPTIEKLVPYLTAMLDRPAGSPEGGPMHVDGAYSWFRRQHPDIVTLATPSPIAEQRASRTDIHALPLSDRLPVIREAKEIMRRVMSGRR